jgi:hypothetical protein
LDESIYSSNDEAALGAMPTVDEAPTPAAEEAVAPAVTEAAPTQQTEQPEPEAPAEPTPAEPPFNPDGPGDLRVALQREREQARALREHLQAVEAEQAQMRAWIAQQQEAAKEAQFRQQLEAYADDPDALAQVLQAKQRELQQAAEAQAHTARLQMSADLARQMYPDFEQQLGKLYAQLGADVVDRMAAQQPNPALWAYQMAKQAFLTPAEIEAQVEARVQARLAELAPRTKPQTPTSSRGIGHLPAAAAPVDAAPENELLRALNLDPGNRGWDAAYSKLLEAAGG